MLTDVYDAPVDLRNTPNSRDRDVAAGDETGHVRCCEREWDRRCTLQFLLKE